MKLIKLLKNFSRKLKATCSCMKDESSATDPAACHDAQDNLTYGTTSSINYAARSSTPAAACRPLTNTTWETVSNTSRLPSQLTSELPTVPSLPPINTTSTNLLDANDQFYNARPRNQYAGYVAYRPLEPSPKHSTADDKHSEDFEDPKDLNECKNCENMEIELQQISCENEEQVETTRRLQHDLCEQNRINACLLASKFSNPRKLKKHIKHLAAELHAKEVEIGQMEEKWREGSSMLKIAAGISKIEGVVSKSTSLMEMCEKGHERLKVEIEVREKRIRRKEKGMGICWPIGDVD